MITGATLGVASLAYGAYWKYFKQHRNKDFPPGPTPLPVMGNLNYMMGAPHRNLTKLGEEYNGIVSLQLGEHPAIFISDPDYIKQVFVTNSAKMNGRFHLDFFDVLTPSIVFSDGNAWRKARGIMHPTVFTIDAVKDQAYPVLMDVAHKWVKRFREGVGKPREKVVIDNELASMAVILEITTSTKLWTPNEKGEMVQNPAADIIVESVALMIACSTMVPHTFLPWLRKIQANPNVVGMIKAKNMITEVCTKIFDDHEKTFNPDKPPRNMIDRYLANKDALGTREDILIYIMTDIFAAGTDTTAGSLSWGLFELARRPEVQQKIRDEIKEKLGNRDPTYQEIWELRYLQAFTQENLRFNAHVPFNLPRSNTEELQVGPYTIPADSLIFCNTGALSRHKSWGDPDVFRPERWFEKDVNEKFRYLISTFGFGARACLGENLARCELMVFFLFIVRSFKLSLPEGYTEPKEKIANVIKPENYPLILTEL